MANENSGPSRLLSVSNLIIIPPVLKTELIDAADQKKGEEFFRKFRIGDLIVCFGQFKAAYDEGIRILNECRNADIMAYSEIHKGGIYYWLGMASFLLRDYQTATFFFDAAVSEDLRRGCEPVGNSTPALKFIQIESESNQQAAQPLVEQTKVKIESLINQYNQCLCKNSNRTNFDVSCLQKKFLRPAVSHDHRHWRSLATTFISFFIEWNDRNEFLDLRIGNGTAEPFYIHLFKGCVLFESLIKANPIKTPPLMNSDGKYFTLINCLQHVYRELGIANDLKIGESDLPTILGELENVSSISIQSAVEFTGKIRNSVGHNLGWDIQFNKTDYQKLFTMIALANLHVIACLY